MLLACVAAFLLYLTFTIAKIGTAWATQYGHATGVAATVDGYTGSLPMILFVCGDC